MNFVEIRYPNPTFMTRDFIIPASRPSPEMAFQTGPITVIKPLHVLNLPVSGQQYSLALPNLTHPGVHKTGKFRRFVKTRFHRHLVPTEPKAKQLNSEVLCFRKFLHFRWIVAPEDFRASQSFVNLLDVFLCVASKSTL